MGRVSDGVTVRHEIIGPAPAESYRSTFATFTAPLAQGDPLPPGWEALYFPFDSAIDGLRPDGSPLDDGVPDFGLPRRMYAGEDTTFHTPLRIGDRVERRESLGAVTEKTGRSGRLAFIDIERRFYVDGRLAVETVWHDVFREAAPTRSRIASGRGSDSFGAGGRAAGVREHIREGTSGRPDWVESFTPDPRHLFRFSAVTFNTHRVHYDKTWALGQEGLPDLLVHGPLTRILLVDAAVRHSGGRSPNRVVFQALSPLYVNDAMTIVGVGDTTGCDVSADNPDGRPAARAKVAWAPA